MRQVLCCGRGADRHHVGGKHSIVVFYQLAQCGVQWDVRDGLPDVGEDIPFVVKGGVFELGQGGCNLGLQAGGEMLAAGCSRNTECVGYGKAGLSHSDEVGRLCSKGDAGDIGGGVKWYDFDYVHSP